jgi:hypothetical protein
MTLNGGSITSNELQKFLVASYEEPAALNILGYVLDEELSKLSKLVNQTTARVYVDEVNKKVIVSHRGTGGEMAGTDWLNNVVYAGSSSAYKMTPRYKRAKAVQDAVHKKYKGYIINVLGHSQGGLIAHLVGISSNNIITLNPAYKYENIGTNEYIVRSSNDVVSAASVPKKMLNEALYPGWTKKHMITIPAETNDPIIEHSPNILERIDSNTKIGSGLPKKKKKRELKGYQINILL